MKQNKRKSKINFLTEKEINAGDRVISVRSKNFKQRKEQIRKSLFENTNSLTKINRLGLLLLFISLMDYITFVNSTEDFDIFAALIIFVIGLYLFLRGSE